MTPGSTLITRVILRTPSKTSEPCLGQYTANIAALLRFAALGTS
jgi:hypothetical protein